MLGTLNY